MVQSWNKAIARCVRQRSTNKWRPDNMAKRSQDYFASVISCIVIELHKLRHLVRHRLWYAADDVEGEQKKLHGSRKRTWARGFHDWDFSQIHRCKDAQIHKAFTISHGNSQSHNFTCSQSDSINSQDRWIRH
jgi:hypothetical protein